MPRISEQLHANFTISANQREYFFGYTRFRHVISFVQTILKKKFTLLGRKSPFWRESPVVIGHFKIRVSQKQQITFTPNPHFLTKSVNRFHFSSHIRLFAVASDNMVGVAPLSLDLH